MNDLLDPRMSRRLLLLPLSLLASSGVPACDDAIDPNCVCTDEFRIYTLAVIDDASQPISDAQVTVTNLRTGRTLISGWLGMLVPGSYVIADDGMRDEFRRGTGDRVRVSVSRAGLSATAEFVFQLDDCRCHVQKVSGPDTVVLGEAPPQ